jgi:hypothetical protein
LNVRSSKKGSGIALAKAKSGMPTGDPIGLLKAQQPIFFFPPSNCMAVWPIAEEREKKLRPAGSLSILTGNSPQGRRAFYSKRPMLIVKGGCLSNH